MSKLNDWNGNYVWLDQLTAEQAEKQLRYLEKRHPDYKFRVIPSEFSPEFFQVEGKKIAGLA